MEYTTVAHLLPIIDERLLAMINARTHAHTHRDKSIQKLMNLLAETIKGHVRYMSVCIKLSLYASGWMQTHPDARRESDSEAYVYKVVAIKLSVHNCTR